MSSESARPLPLPDAGSHAEHALADARTLRRALRRELRRRRQGAQYNDDNGGTADAMGDNGSATVGAPVAVFGFAEGRLHPLANDVTESIAEPSAQPLLGLRVPERYDAIAAIAASVMTTSRRRHLDATLAVAVSRAGSEICFLDGGIDVIETWHPQGWLIDACRRALGLTTGPTSAQPVDLSLALWLDYLLVGLVEHRTISWEDAAACCPVTGPLTTDPVDLGDRLASSAPTWSALRSAAASGAPMPVPVRADHAAWMDDAMFARWVLGFFPDLDELRSDIEFLASAEIADAVERVIKAARRWR